MVQPADVPLILADAARLVAQGEIVVFGSAALALSLPSAPATRDVDLWVTPPERGELVEALMGELSWYMERHGAYVEVWGPETFAAPEDWRARARVLQNPEAPGVRLVVPHPHDVLLAKLERWEPHDRAHAELILAAFPLSAAEIEQLAARTPYRGGRLSPGERGRRFEAHLAELKATLRG